MNKITNGNYNYKANKYIIKISKKYCVNKEYLVNLLLFRKYRYFTDNVKKKLGSGKNESIDVRLQNQALAS